MHFLEYWYYVLSDILLLENVSNLTAADIQNYK